MSEHRFQQGKLLASIVQSAPEFIPQTRTRIAPNFNECRLLIGQFTGLASEKVVRPARFEAHGQQTAAPTTTGYGEERSRHRANDITAARLHEWPGRRSAKAKEQIDAAVWRHTVGAVAAASHSIVQ